MRSRVAASGRSSNPSSPLTGPSARSPISGGTTPRRVVRSLKAPLSCVAQLVNLDGGQPSACRRFSTLLEGLNDNSVSEVRSELCSATADDHDTSVSSSYFDPKRNLASQRLSPSTTRRGKRGAGERRQQKRHRSTRKPSVVSRGTRPVESSTELSYTGCPSFYSCESLSSSSSTPSSRSHSSKSESGEGTSYTAISESVPSCSLTVVGESQTRHLPAGGRGRQQHIQRSFSSSFGSLLGGDGFNQYDGTSLCSYPAQSTNEGASVSVNAAREDGLGITLAAPSPGRESQPLSPQCTQSEARTPVHLEATNGPSALSSFGVDMESANADPTSHKKATPKTTSASNGTAKPAKENAAEKKAPKMNASGPLTPESPSAASTTAADATAAAAIAPTTDAVTTSSKAEDTSQIKVVNAKKEMLIGRGTFGEVYRGIDLDTGRVIAIKEIVVEAEFYIDTEKQLSKLEREITVMRKLNHPNIVNYLGAGHEDTTLQIFMEWVAGGTIHDRLREFGRFSEDTTRHYINQLLSGLDYLHGRQIVHRDLKGDNLFVTLDEVLKLGDFGTSKELVATLVTDSVTGTPNFMAPEVISSSGHSYAADIWSVGCCVVEMLTARPPFYSLDNHISVMFAIIHDKIKDEIPATASPGARDFILACTKVHPEDRPTAHELRRHPWLRGEWCDAPLPQPQPAPEVPSSTTTTTTKTTTAPPATTTTTTTTTSTATTPSGKKETTGKGKDRHHGEKAKEEEKRHGSTSTPPTDKNNSSEAPTNAPRDVPPPPTTTTMPPLANAAPPPPPRRPASTNRTKSTPLDASALVRAAASEEPIVLPQTKLSPAKSTDEGVPSTHEAGPTSSSNVSSKETTPSAASQSARRHHPRKESVPERGELPSPTPTTSQKLTPTLPPTPPSTGSSGGRPRLASTTPALALPTKDGAHSGAGKGSPAGAGAAAAAPCSSPQSPQASQSATVSPRRRSSPKQLQPHPPQTPTPSKAKKHSTSGAPPATSSPSRSPSRQSRGSLQGNGETTPNRAASPPPAKTKQSGRRSNSQQSQSVKNQPVPPTGTPPPHHPRRQQGQRPISPAAKKPGRRRSSNNNA